MSVYPASATAAAIINQVAAEVGLTIVADPYASEDNNFIQLRTLLKSVGDELSLMYPWQVLRRQHDITTVATDTGDYPLPEDFAVLTDSTAWDATSQKPLQGPLAPHEWSRLEADQVIALITFGFRIQEGTFSLYPNNPVGMAHDLFFEYTSTQWVLDTDGVTLKDTVETGTDTPIYHRILVQRYLKVKWLLAKQLDATAAQDDFNQMMDILTGGDKGGRVLDAGGHGLRVHYIDNHNVSDTGYGV